MNSDLNFSIWANNILIHIQLEVLFRFRTPVYEDEIYLSYGEPFTIGLNLNYKF